MDQAPEASQTARDEAALIVRSAHARDDVMRTQASRATDEGIGEGIDEVRRSCYQRRTPL
jgi:hypothetical protein